jgi:D-psicose/D-tagatose/L-ribulose 3-epimerase
MKLAASMIGWTAAEDAWILPRLCDAGVEAVEAAPTRVFADPSAATLSEALEVGARLRAAGLPVVSMQSLLFGRPDLRLFGSPEEVRALVEHLGRIIALAGTLGCGPLVFGSPRNRLRGGRSFADAQAEAVPTLRTIAAMARDAGTIFCLEANAANYGCDFMNVLSEAGDVVEAVDEPGIGQVVDTGNMMMEGELPSAISAVRAHMRHVHVSAPQLGPVADHKDYVTEVVSVLKDVGYDGVVTLEMRPGDGSDPTANLLRAAAMLRGLIDLK